MRCHISRRAVRRLLTAHPPFVRACPLYIHHAPPHPALHAGTTRVDRRTVVSFMQLFEAPGQDESNQAQTRQRKTIATPKLDPGMEAMFNLTKRLDHAVRLPDQKDLVKAWKALIHSKTKYSRPINDFHAVPMLETLKVLERRHDPESSPSLDHDTFIATLRALEIVPTQGYTQSHRQLALALAEALKRRNPTETSPPPKVLISILASTGHVVEARNLLEAFAVAHPEHGKGSIPRESGQQQNGQELDKTVDLLRKLGKRTAPWLSLLVGFSQQQNDQELQKTIDLMQNLGIKFTPSAIRTIAVLYARSDNIPKAKEWFSKVDFSKDVVPTAGTTLGLADKDNVYQTLLEFCLRNGEMKFGNSILHKVEQGDAFSNKWLAIFKASAATGKSVEEMDEMVAVMSRRADQTRQEELRPEADIFNGIIRFAIAKKDPYLAERYYGLMQKWGVVPDNVTYLLQVEYRLIAGDFNGALAAYNNIRHVDATKDQDFSQVEARQIYNKLLQQATVTPKVPHQTIMNLLRDILNPEIVLPAPSVLALTKYHLHRDEYANLVDLLQTYSYQYSTTERIEIRDMLLDFSMDTANNTGRAWDTYMVWHQVFDVETARRPRQAAMANFFARGRPDLATYVFTRMSRHERPDTRPDLDTYVAAFEGIAATREPDALEVVHNQLKLDTDVEPCTRLLNSLMLAYACCGLPGGALSFWRDIAMSTEGPSYNSLAIALRACEKAPAGRAVAGDIWKQLLAADVEIDARLFNSWLCMLAAQGLYSELYAELDKMQDVTGDEPDLLTVQSLFNAVPGMSGQRDIQAYCSDKYPSLLTQLKAFQEEHGVERDQWGVPRLNGVVRTFPA